MIGMPQPPDAAPVAASGLQRAGLTTARRHELLLGLLLLLCYGFFFQVPAWNEHSRYDLTVALVDHRTLQIDELHTNTGDKAYYNGHYYSDKAPGTALLGMPVYATLRVAAAITGSARPDARQVIYALTFAISGLPTALLALLLLRFLRPFVGEWWALTMSVGYGLGSLAFPFATMFFGHAAAACFLFAAFYALWRSQPGTAGLPLLAGFLAGWAVLVEYPALLGAIVLVGYALTRTRRAALPMLAGAAPVAVVLLVYNWAAFGGPFQLGYANLVEGSFAAGMQQGILGVTWPKADALVTILAGPRGILRLSPWLVWVPFGLWAFRRPELRREVALCGAVVVLFLLYNAGYYLPLGGWTPGPRFLLPALPFAAVLAALAARAFRPLIALQVAFSVVLFSVVTATMPNAPEKFQHPLRELWLAMLMSRDLATTTAWLRWGLHGLQPLALLLSAFALAAIGFIAGAAATRGGNRLATLTLVVLAALVVTLGTPLAITFRGLPLARPADLAIVEAGMTRGLADAGGEQIRPWAQLENGDSALAETRVFFAIFNASGERVWAAWHSDVDWRPWERKDLRVEWQPQGVAAGTYRLDVEVTSMDEQTVYARVSNAAQVRVRPAP